MESSGARSALDGECCVNPAELLRSETPVLHPSQPSLDEPFMDDAGAPFCASAPPRAMSPLFLGAPAVRDSFQSAYAAHDILSCAPDAPTHLAYPPAVSTLSPGGSSTAASPEARPTPSAFPEHPSTLRCPHCDHVQGNGRNQDMRRHIKTHDTARPKFECGRRDCQAVFSRLDGKRRHQRNPRAKCAPESGL
ncbi:hypothetical protein FA95DRAFT_1562808 [Auriscalpium vulgare]|uniref:Uncharacterized protein n=1 Tax=Auriscalpium vulgare TaxID=40419 RepID=A0ACB8RIF5_9AGAM|nr:hypothetical protein FA95DRAFT_1562808 [Auriscalpium vulgare]